MRYGWVAVFGILLLSMLSAGECAPDDFDFKSNPAVIRQISVSGTRTLSTVELREIRHRLLGLCVDRDNDAGTSIGELIVDAFQRQGFFKAALKGPVKISSPEPLLRPIPLNVSASVNEGHRYRFGNVEFKGNKAFTSEELRRLVPLTHGDIFDIENVRQALSAFRNLYGEQGYINFTPVPDTIFHESDHSITLVIELDEGPQFRLGRFEVIGVREIAEPIVKDWRLKTGDIFDGSKVWAFLAQHVGNLQRNSFHMKQNNETNTIDIRIVICPPDYYCFDP